MPGVEFDGKTSISRKGIEPTQVKSIKLMTDLDDGAANDNSGTIKPKSGVVFGKTYTFKVETYTNDAPKDNDLIKWVVSYTDSETGQYYQNTLEDVVTGDTINIKFKNQSMCGNNLQVKAYINDLENEGKLDVFKHNRFRYFDKQIIKTEIQQRMFTGIDVEQGESSMCGIAIIGHLLAIENPTEYQKIILNLHQKGEAIVSSTKYKITLDTDDHLCAIKDSDTVYPKNKYGNRLSYADYVLLFSIKDYLNNVFDYDPDGPNSGVGVEGITGFTPPFEVKGMMKNILSYTEVNNNTNIVTSKWSSVENSVKELQELLKNDYRTAILISADNFSKNQKSIITVPNHWVGLKGISIDPTTELVTVVVFTWGYISQNWTMSYDSFKDGYFGYVTGK